MELRVDSNMVQLTDVMKLGKQHVDIHHYITSEWNSRMMMVYVVIFTILVSFAANQHVLSNSEQGGAGVAIGVLLLQDRTQSSSPFSWVLIISALVTLFFAFILGIIVTLGSSMINKLIARLPTKFQRQRRGVRDDAGARIIEAATTSVEADGGMMPQRRVQSNPRRSHWNDEESLGTPVAESGPKNWLKRMSRMPGH